MDSEQGLKSPAKPKILVAKNWLGSDSSRLVRRSAPAPSTFFPCAPLPPGSFSRATTQEEALAEGTTKQAVNLVVSALLSLKGGKKL